MISEHLRLEHLDTLGPPPDSSGLASPVQVLDQVLEHLVESLVASGLARLRRTIFTSWWLRHDWFLKSCETHRARVEVSVCVHGDGETLQEPKHTTTPLTFAWNPLRSLLQTRFPAQHHHILTKAHYLANIASTIG